MRSTGAAHDTMSAHHIEEPLMFSLCILDHVYVFPDFAEKLDRSFDFVSRRRPWEPNHVSDNHEGRKRRIPMGTKGENKTNWSRSLI